MKIFSSKNLNKKIFLLLTICLGLVLFYPHRNFQLLLAQGDHGIGLYAPWAILQGEHVYKDFTWFYGPFMPYYYALCLKFFGMNIQSILLGKFLLVFLSGLLFYFILASVIRPSFAFWGTFWFFCFQNDFFHTYNHAGGIFCMLFILYCIFLYLKEPLLKYIYTALILVFILAFIKINFAFSSLLGLLISLALIDRARKGSLSPRKKMAYIVGFFFLPAAILLCYYFMFLKDLPVHVIRQCFPYLSADHPHNTSIFAAGKILIGSLYRNVTSSLPDVLFAGIIMFSGLQVFALTKQKNSYPMSPKNILNILCVLTLFYVLSLHEFLVSGVYYRSFWANPFSILLMFVVMGWASQNFSFIIRFIFQAAIALILILRTLNGLDVAVLLKKPPHYLDLKMGKIYVGNEEPWMRTVTLTSMYLEKYLRKDELFFALPYDPLYYFFLDKKSPTRQLIFFEHINIGPQQEKEIIEELEEHDVRWVVVSNRSRSGETGLGILGETYCPLIGDYLEENFSIAAEFGDWTNPPGWAWNHGTRILKKHAKGYIPNQESP